jgi:hypothetical protein
MVFTGDTLAPERRRRGVAVEPMTCAPDAFRSGAGLITLEPGERHVARWGVEPVESAGGDSIGSYAGAELPVVHRTSGL